jgi:hypothetical protein
MRLLVTPSFERVVKKLHPKQKCELDEAVRLIANHPERGEAKVGDTTSMLRSHFSQVLPAAPNYITILRIEFQHEAATSCFSAAINVLPEPLK